MRLCGFVKKKSRVAENFFCIFLFTPSGCFLFSLRRQHELAKPKTKTKMKTIIDCEGNVMGEGKTASEAIRNCAKNLGISVQDVETIIETTYLVGYTGDDSTLILQ
jgi:hypothetical protein